MKAQDVHDAEQAVLGSVLLSPNCLDSVRAVIGDEGRVFVSEPHQLLYRAMLHLQVGGLPIDPLTLKQRLAEDREPDAVGGITYIGVGPFELTGRFQAIATNHTNGILISEDAEIQEIS